MSTEILDQLEVGVIIHDMNDNIRYTNVALKKIFKSLPIKPVGMKIYDNAFPWISGIKNTRENNPILEAKKFGSNLNEMIEMHLENGETIKVSIFASPLRNKKGMMIGAINLFIIAKPTNSTEEAKNKLYSVLKKYISNNAFNHIITGLRTQIPSATKCFITIAFIDIVGFSSMAEKLDPHQTVNMLNIFFSRVHKTITKYKGDIDKYLGDAILATFFNAEASVRCFTEVLLADLPIINAQLNKRFPELPPLGVHVGINTGWVILGEVGAFDRKELTVIGDDVNTAARIQALTPPNEIWISARTVANIGEFNKLLKDADLIKVKGKSAPIKVYKFDPAHITLNNKVMLFEKEETLSNQIIEALKTKGIHSYTHADTMDKLDSQLTGDYESIIVGPSASTRELVSIQKIIEKVGLSNDILIPISKDTSQKTIDMLESHGIKTFIPLSEGKQFENNLENIMRTQKINKIPMKKQINETDSPDDAIILNRDELSETNSNENEFLKMENDSIAANLSDSLIYSKQPDRLMITLMKILNTNLLNQLADNIQKIWEYDYHSKSDFNIVFKLDTKLNMHIENESILKMIECIFKQSKLISKGWSKGFLIFKSNAPILPEILKQYEGDYRVKLEND